MAKKQFLSVETIQLSILKSNPPQVFVAVTGMATTAGWSNAELKPLEKKLSEDGILDLDFIGTPPKGLAPQVLAPVSASLIWEDDVERLVGVKIYSRSEDVIQLLGGQEGEPVIAPSHGTMPNSIPNAELSKTFPTGEEGKTHVRGEELKTLLRGEEGKTRIRGEEFKTTIRAEEFKTCLLYTSPSPRDQRGSRMPSSA